MYKRERCGNERAGEQALSIRKREGAHLPVYSVACKGCKLLLNNIAILGKSKNKLVHEVLEAFFFASKKGAMTA